MKDEKTPYLNLPLPSGENTLDQDLPRLRAAFDLLDGNAAANGQETAARAARAQSLETRATAEREPQAGRPPLWLGDHWRGGRRGRGGGGRHHRRTARQGQQQTGEPDSEKNCLFIIANHSYFR